MDKKTTYFLIYKKKPTNNSVLKYSFFFRQIKIKHENINYKYININ